MSNTVNLREKFSAFVNQLSPDQVREQLILALLQMERCLQVLHGEDVKPVVMLDYGMSSDLELFYNCKKVAGELDYLNKMVHDCKKVVVPKFKTGDEVWYMFGDRIQHSTIEYMMNDYDGTIFYKTKLDHTTAVCETFCSLEELIENLKKSVNE